MPSLRIGYARSDAADVLAQTDVLAAISFGAPLHADDPRRVHVNLNVVGEPLLEVWRGNGRVDAGRDGDIRWSSDGEHGFFAIEIAEPDADDIVAAAERAYAELIPFVHASATPHVLRLWNYFDAINLGVGDAERYRRFCVGRARGMAGVWQDRYPAATAIGRRDGTRVLQVYALASRSAGLPVENPRQVNAWRYPREYGPSPPTFARGMVDDDGTLLISGTAAVVGAASCHDKDVVAQLDETLTNIASLIGSATGERATGPGRGSLLKVYVRNADDAPRVAARLRARAGDVDGVLLLVGDICRRELLVEIDGLHA